MAWAENERTIERGAELRHARAEQGSDWRLPHRFRTCEKIMDRAIRQGGHHETVSCSFPIRYFDRWALHRLQRLVQRVGRAYDEFEFHIVFHSIHNFCAVDMSAFYLDILKDRLYTAKASSPERRSGQTVMERVLSTLVRLMAPVLSFTADEVWAYMPGEKKMPSVFLSDFPKPEDRYIDDGLEARWDKLLAVRGEAAKVLEGLRKDKAIGHSLDAGVTLYAEPGLHALLNRYRDDLPFIFIVSAAELAKESEAPADAFTSDSIKGLKITAAPAKGEKCGRCWMYSTTIGTVKEHPQICGRCAGNLA